MPEKSIMPLTIATLWTADVPRAFCTCCGYSPVIEIIPSVVSVMKFVPEAIPESPRVYVSGELRSLRGDLVPRSFARQVDTQRAVLLGHFLSIEVSHPFAAAVQRVHRQRLHLGSQLHDALHALHHHHPGPRKDAGRFIRAGSGRQGPPLG